MSSYANGTSKVMLHLPTGAGKTVIAIFIIKEILKCSPGSKILFVAHRREILEQTTAKIQGEIPGVAVQIEQGSQRVTDEAQIVVASIQSMVKRKTKFDASAFSLIICDECHHAFAKTWYEILEYFCKSNSNIFLVGMTATPKRTDGRSAIDLFGDVAFDISIMDLQDEGYLVPINYYTIKTELNLANIKMSQGDFQISQLSQVMNSRKVRALTIGAWQEKAQGKKTIVFCAGIEHAHQLAGDFCAFGAKASAIDGRMKDRDTIIADFREGHLNLLTNYGVLTEGFDDPEIECIIMARPTTSPLVYNQCLGRGLRTLPGKKSCVVIDIVDRSQNPLQYKATESFGLKPGWRSKGRDPMKEARAVARVRVTDPAAFLRIKNALSLEEVQSILIDLPKEVVLAGLDGEPHIRYQKQREKCPASLAIQIASDILKQANIPFKKIVIDSEIIKVASQTLEHNHHIYQWHIFNATGWEMEVTKSRRRISTGYCRRLLRSMLGQDQKLHDSQYLEDNNCFSAHVSGLTAEEFAAFSANFKKESGVDLKLKGQQALPFF